MPYKFRFLLLFCLIQFQVNAALNIHETAFALHFYNQGNSAKAVAMVFTTKEPEGDHGSAELSSVSKINPNSPERTLAHEMLHTFGVPDNDYKSGGLRHSPPQPIISSEIDLILDASYNKTKPSKE